MADFTITNHGTIYLLRPFTDEAHEWVKEHLPDGVMSFAGAVVVDQHHLGDIVTGIRDDGLTIKMED